MYIHFVGKHRIIESEKGLGSTENHRIFFLYKILLYTFIDQNLSDIQLFTVKKQLEMQLLTLDDKEKTSTFGVYGLTLCIKISNLKLLLGANLGILVQTFAKGLLFYISCIVCSRTLKK